MDKRATQNHEIYTKIQQAIKDRIMAVLVTIIASNDEAQVGAKSLYTVLDGELHVEASFLPSDLAPACLEAATGLVTLNDNRGRSKTGRITVLPLPHQPDVTVAFELVRRAPQFVIVGGGHIAVPTHTIAAEVGFDVTVLDDRPMYANTRRFPRAQKVVCDSFSSGISGIQTDAETAVIVITRGHLHDLEVIRQLQDKTLGYLGMIGSKRRVLTVVERLRKEGFQHLINQLYAPIGLDIGAESPAEIGLSIVAEVVSVMRGRPGGHLRWLRGLNGVGDEA